ncbi:MAG: hypothetical protein J6Y62_03860 [Clostridia bacterium]|nr:hypothetical protein [Clostridia bacterium]
MKDFGKEKLEILDSLLKCVDYLNARSGDRALRRREVGPVHVARYCNPEKESRRWMAEVSGETVSMTCYAPTPAVLTEKVLRRLGGKWRRMRGDVEALARGIPAWDGLGSRKTKHGGASLTLWEDRRPHGTFRYAYVSAGEGDYRVEFETELPDGADPVQAVMREFDRR